MSNASQPASTAKTPLTQPLTIILISRLGLFLLSYCGLVLLPDARMPSDTLPGNLPLAGWVQWDSRWYGQIAQHGYTNVAVDDSGQRDTMYMPALPLAARCVGALLGDVYLGGLIVANASFVIAALLLFRLAESQWGEELARRTLVMLCVYPLSFFLSAMYSESLFLLSAVATFYFGQRRQWLVAALCASIAGTTRIAGVITPIALVLMYLQAAEWRWRNCRRDSLFLLVGFAGLGAHILFLAIKFGEPFAFAASFRAHGWAELSSFAAMKETLHTFGTIRFDDISAGHLPLREGIQIMIGLFAIVISFISWRRLPVAYAAWVSMLVLISLTAWAGFGRHFSTAFPAFIVLAMILKDQRLYHGLIYLSLLLLALFTLMFTHGNWVA